MDNNQREGNSLKQKTVLIKKFIEKILESSGSESKLAQIGDSILSCSIDIEILLRRVLDLKLNDRWNIKNKKKKDEENEEKKKVLKKYTFPHDDPEKFLQKVQESAERYRDKKDLDGIDGIVISEKDIQVLNIKDIDFQHV